MKNILNQHGFHKGLLQGSTKEALMRTPMLWITVSTEIKMWINSSSFRWSSLRSSPSGILCARGRSQLGPILSFILMIYWTISGLLFAEDCISLGYMKCRIYNLTLCPLAIEPSGNNLCKQFGPGSGSNLFDTRMFFSKRNQQTTIT